MSRGSGVSVLFLHLEVSENGHDFNFIIIIIFSIINQNLVEDRAVVSRDIIFQCLGLEGLESRSRLCTLKSRKTGMCRRDI